MEEVLEVRQSRRWSVGTLGNKSFFLRGITETLTAKEEEKRKGKIRRKRKSNYVIYLMADTSKIVARCRRSAQTFTRRSFSFRFLFLPSERERTNRDEVRKSKDRGGGEKRNQ